MERNCDFKSVDLFAGIGGIRKGFELAAESMDASIDTVFVSEFDKYAVKTYAANFCSPKHEIEGADELLMYPGTLSDLRSEASGDTPQDSVGPKIYGDITKFDDAMLGAIPDFDICLAGFPCQAFSLAGQRMGLEDDYKGMSRGTLFQEIIRICEIKKPKAVVCENVKGLLHHDGGKTLRVIIGAFKQANYEPKFKVLNSKDFGVPQNRERLYLVAFRNDISLDGFCFPEGNGPSITLENILEKKAVGSKYFLSQGYLDTLKKHKERHAEQGHGFGYCIRKATDIAGTICCGGMGRERNLVVDEKGFAGEEITIKHTPINGEHVRMLTPREWARLQGFPDGFKLPVADTHLYKQFGNTVTVPVVQAVAEKVLEHLRNWEHSVEASNARKGAVLECVKASPCRRDEVVRKLSSLHLSSVDTAVISNEVSYILQVLKKEGKVALRGHARGATWFCTLEA